MTGSWWSEQALGCISAAQSSHSMKFVWKKSDRTKKQNVHENDYDKRYSSKNNTKEWRLRQYSRTAHTHAHTRMLTSVHGHTHMYAHGCTVVHALALTHVHSFTHARAYMEAHIITGLLRVSICQFFYSLSVNIFMSHSLLWRHIVLLTVGVYLQPQSVIYHWNQYDEEISKKLGPSFRL